MMHRFVRGLITEWRRLGSQFEGETAIVAVSGGADSVSMLLALADLLTRKKLSLRLVVAHFDHGLRGAESKADAEFVRGLATSLGLEFVLGKGRIAKTGNLEQNARNARYAYLLKAASDQKAFAVLTAHTLNDQAETLLINLIRGSGPEGLAAMQPVKEFDGSQIKLIRPLVRWATRRETEAFCKHMKIEPRVDAMNIDPAFTRVRIRRELLPMLETFNPKIVETLARTTQLMQGSAEAPRNKPDIEMSIQYLRSFEKARLYSVIRSWLRANRGNLRSLQLKHIEAIDRLIHSPKSGRMIELPGGGRVMKQKGRLVYINITVEK